MGTRVYTLNLMRNCGKRYYTVSYTYVCTRIYLRKYYPVYMRKRTTYTTLSLALELSMHFNFNSSNYARVPTPVHVHMAYTCTYIYQNTWQP